MLYFSMFVLGWEGMPRRYYDYLPKFNTPNLVSTIGSWILAMGLLHHVLQSDPIRSSREKKSGDNPWDGGHARMADDLAAAGGELRRRYPSVTKGPYEYR